MPGVVMLSAAEPSRQPAPGAQRPIRFNNYARRMPSPLERPFYQWRVFVDEPPPVLSRIAQVDYILHPTFPEPFQTSRDRANRFAINATGWGEFTIGLTIHFTDGTEMPAAYYLDLRRGWPAETTDVILNWISVDWDGSPGATGWMFDVLIDGRLALQLPNRNYDDERPKRPRGSEFVPPPSEQFVGALAPGARSPWIEVRGRRSFGGDSAQGGAPINMTGQPFAVSVTNPNPTAGSFVFHFSTRASSRGAVTN
jgi:hypothetical protein